MSGCQVNIIPKPSNNIYKALTEFCLPRPPMEVDTMYRSSYIVACVWRGDCKIINIVEVRRARGGCKIMKIADRVQ